MHVNIYFMKAKVIDQWEKFDSLINRFVSADHILI